MHHNEFEKGKLLEKPLSASPLTGRSAVRSQSPTFCVLKYLKILNPTLLYTVNTDI